MVEECKVSREQVTTNVSHKDTVKSGLCVHKGGGEAKEPWISDSCGSNSDETSKVENSTPAERGCRYWRDKGVTFAVKY